MVRALFRLTAAVSLLLFVATAGLWVRGRRTMDHFWLIHGDGGSEMVRSAGGRLTFRHSRPNARARITLPRRFSHWACAVGSQLPPKPSPLHWEWRFLSYEATPAATAAEVRGALLAQKEAAAVRSELGVSDREWDEALRARRHFAALYPGEPGPDERLLKIQVAKLAHNRAHDLLRGSSYWEWTFPAWLAAAVTAAAPALWLAGWRRRRRVLREGRCPDCGYDLRASRRRCPECGLQIGPADAAPDAAPVAASDAAAPAFAAATDRAPASALTPPRTA